MKRSEEEDWVEDLLGKVLPKALPENWPAEFADGLEPVWREALKPLVPPSWPASFQERLVLHVRGEFMERLRGEDLHGPLREDVRGWIEAQRAAGRAKRDIAQGARAYADERVEALLPPVVEEAGQESAERLQEVFAETLADVERIGELGPKELHRVATRYNWDDGPVYLFAIIRNPQCALGTALLLYWRGSPHFFLQYGDRSEVPDYSLDNYDLLMEIEKKVQANGFEHHGIAYDPRKDGGDLTQPGEAEDEPKREIPDAMFTATRRWRADAHFPPPKSR